MDTQSEPFLSVVLPVYNGSVTIGRALDALLAQDYPRHKYEVIVVNDGSTDDTADVVATFPDVRHIELSRNMGIPSAQNAGLEAAKGDIYVAFNDDFQAAPDFLSKLADAYRELDKPLGIGGAVANDSSSRRKGLTAKFIEANHVGAAPNVVNLRLPFTPNVIKRLLTYVITNFSQDQYIERDEAATQEVVELYGANASFPISKLREIGGWDVSTAAPAIGGIEDRDVCYRLRQRFPDHHFYVARSARIMMDLDANDSSVSIRSYLLRPYRRGPFNYVFHIKNGITPPLFPFPPLILLALLAGAILTPLLLPLWIVALPQICYGWWARRAVAERRPVYLLFPYLQVAEEAMVLTGLLKGAVMHAAGKLAIN
jgi:glycosyltransferase involved in cell wall biosynthesis